MFAECNLYFAACQAGLHMLELYWQLLGGLGKVEEGRKSAADCMPPSTVAPPQMVAILLRLAIAQQVLTH
jgi:hypothetical protein